MEAIAQMYAVDSACFLLSIPILIIANIWSAFWPKLYIEMIFSQSYLQDCNCKISFSCINSSEFITTYLKIGLTLFWVLKSFSFYEKSSWSTQITAPCWRKRQNFVKFLVLKRTYTRHQSIVTRYNISCFQELSCWVTWAHSQAQIQHSESNKWGKVGNKRLWFTDTSLLNILGRAKTRYQSQSLGLGLTPQIMFDALICSGFTALNC